MSLFDKNQYLCPRFVSPKDNLIMNVKMIGRLKWLCYMSLFVCACWFLFVCYQNFNFIFDTAHRHIHLDAKNTVVAYTATIFVLHLFFTFGLIAAFVTFFVNVLRGIRREELFPKANVAVINIGAILIFLQTVAADNFDQVFIVDGPGQIVLTSNPFVYALALLVFGAMYKIAYDVAAEHDLTV